MRKILFIISIFASAISFAQDGALKTLTATTASSNTYTITEALPSTYSSKERWQIVFQNANTGTATLERIVGGVGLGAKTLKKSDGSNLSANDIRSSTPYLITYNGTNYICETCCLVSSITTGNLTTPTTGVSITGGTNSVFGSGTTISIQSSTNSQPGLLTAADHTSFAAKVDRAGDTMSGNLAMGGNKVTGLGAANSNGDALRYEQLIGQYLLLSGGTMSGNIAMGSNKVTGLAAATGNGEAVRYEQLPNVSSTQIPYSTGSQSFAGSANLTWNNSINTLSTASITITSNTEFSSISPTGLLGNTDDYNISDGTFFRMTATGAYNLTGIANGADGRMIIIRNIGSNNISLLHDNAGSSAANRFFFSTGTTIVLGADHQISLIYDSTDQRWVDLSVR